MGGTLLRLWTRASELSCNSFDLQSESDSFKDTDDHDGGFPWYSLVPPDNTGIVPYIRPRALPSKSFHTV